MADNQNTLTAGPRGPVLLHDWQLIEKLAHQNRERIAERVVHAKAWGAYRTFTVTNDITRYTTAKVLSDVGERPSLSRAFRLLPGSSLQPTPSATCAVLR